MGDRLVTFTEQLLAANRTLMSRPLIMYPLRVSIALSASPRYAYVVW